MPCDWLVTRWLQAAQARCRDDLTYKGCSLSRKLVCGWRAFYLQRVCAHCVFCESRATRAKWGCLLWRTFEGLALAVNVFVVTLFDTACRKKAALSPLTLEDGEVGAWSWFVERPLTCVFTTGSCCMCASMQHTGLSVSWFSCWLALWQWGWGSQPLLSTFFVLAPNFRHSWWEEQTAVYSAY